QIWDVTSVIEKPSPNEAPSCMALTGRYVFDSSVFRCIEKCSPGRNGEIQLADAMNLLAQGGSLRAMTIEGQRFDAGDKLGYLQANVEVALRHPEVSEDFKNFLIEKVKGLS
ncbi:MAG TPA: UTP--glucose-1-phosphate uridylyltransferase, partial [Bdellovibrionales bacterium]|nr:UTP--glucose-1-phosphate uridylyltransferase [Bdellovibrionales bacterium]